ncbi:MAG: Fe2+-enterobactin ABC transporter substrate-binding protein [Dietzia sp.]
MALTTTRRFTGLLAGSAALLLALAGCGGAGEEASADTDTGQASSEQWPRTFTNADGSTTTIEAKPERIVSTVSVTGTLLAIDAPVVGSTTGGNGDFFGQWSDVAESEGVVPLFPAGSVDIEALIGQDPDLIVTSASGADTLTDNLAELNEIAPTIVVDQGGQTWQDLAEDLGEATGLEDEATAAAEEFDAYVADAAAKIEVPEGTANIISFNGPGETNPIARAGSAHAEILTALGFRVEDPPAEWHSQPQQREDFVFASYENLTELTSATTFILMQDEAGAQAFAEDPVLANLPSVANGAVHGLGKNSFRVDQYSATEIVDSVVENFGG